MSWLARSIANTLKLDDDENAPEPEHPNNTKTHDPSSSSSSPPTSLSPRGVKEDISVLTKTLTRQLWGVATFLAPPPEPSSDPSPTHLSDPDPISGIRSDFAEIGGKFRTGISKLSNNIGVSEITKMASNFLQLGSDDEDRSKGSGVVGVTPEVVAFVSDVAMHPETWLDFPLPQSEGDDDDEEEFDLSDAQQEHALAVERLVPRLAALRIELCPGYMSENCFWKIYFVLLHPRLDRQDAKVLSTPQIVIARASLTQELKNKEKPEQDWSTRGTNVSHEESLSVPFTGQSDSKDITNSSHEEPLSTQSTGQYDSIPIGMSVLESATSTVAADFETDKHPVLSEIPIVDKSVIEEGPVNLYKDQNLHSGSSYNVFEEKDEDEEDDGDDWLKEESSEMVGLNGTTIPIQNEEDVSFSDLEEDDDDVPTSNKKPTYCSDSSTKDSRDWVQLSRSSTDSGKVSARNSEATKESNDWLDVDDIDVA